MSLDSPKLAESSAASQPQSPDASSPEGPASLPEQAIRARAIILGLLLLPVNAYWVVNMEFTRYSAHPTTVSLFFNCIFLLLVLVGINRVVALFSKPLALRKAELLLVYSMLCIGSCMAAHDFGQVLVSSLAYPFAYSTPSHDYQDLLWRYLPKWAMASTITNADGFYHGGDTLYTPEHVALWLKPALVWTGFVVVLLWMMQCVNVLIRKQWTDNERLSYPLVKLPLEITSSDPFGAKSSPLAMYLFWIGFALAAGMDICNTLNYYYPNVPAILTAGSGSNAFDLHNALTVKPWSAIGWTPITFYPFVIGLGLLLPMDFLFSTWFFYIVWKLEAVGVNAFALDADPRMPYANYQALGAYLLFFVATLWLSRGYLSNVLKKALGRPSTLDDTDEPMRYRTALGGVLVSLSLLVGFSQYIGLSWYIAIAFFVLYLALALSITRMRAEMGTPVHDLHFTGPDWTISDLFGPHSLGSQNLAIFGMFFWFNRAYRCHPMPFQLEGLKLAEQSGARKQMRVWVVGMMLAGAFGMLCAFWAILHQTYIHGNPRFGAEGWDRYLSWVTLPKPANHTVLSAIVFGFAFAAFLQTMRATIWWWPFHPLAYAVSGSWEMNLLWMPLLIAWAIKGILMRYGGAGAYTKALPFFYGLILGQFVPGSLINIWGAITNNPTYQFWQ